jgi:hypothetical protein
MIVCVYIGACRGDACVCTCMCVCLYVRACECTSRVCMCVRAHAISTTWWGRRLSVSVAHQLLMQEMLGLIDAHIRTHTCKRC